MSIKELILNEEHMEKKAINFIKGNNKKVMLFGAGAVGVFALKNLREHGIEPVCFCDNNPLKQGKKYLGLDILSYEEFKALNYDYVVIISTANMRAIYDNLTGRGEDSSRIIFMADFRDPWSVKTDYEFVINNINEFDDAYNSLSDNESKKVFIDVLNAKITGKTEEIEKIRGYDQYFDEDIIKLSDDEVFVDVGAFTGDTVLEFVKRVKSKYQKIVAFEPDNFNFENMEKMIIKEKIENVELVKMGAWNKKDTLVFSDELTGSSGVAETMKVTDKITTISVDSIDNVLNGSKVGFIKLDIEGSERKALEGAVNSIKRWKPKIACSVYHKREDMFDIVKLLKTYVKDYKFYMRNYSDTAADTVLYAVV